MKIINLMEDTPGTEGFLYEHGLSFYVETEHHKLLVDTGASDAFMENARKHGIDLTRVDTVILSHGHYDHSGGILAFAKQNPRAKIYMQKSAAGAYYNLRNQIEKYIGIDKRILELPQVQFIDGDCRIDEELLLFSNVTGRKYWAQSNLLLKEKTDAGFLQDEFSHEQSLIIRDGKECVLLSGCAHNGILNILEALLERYQETPTKVISGFHLNKQGEFSEEEVRVIEDTARELKKIGARFFTGHCTGIPAYEIMKRIMGPQLVFVHSGDVVS